MKKVIVCSLAIVFGMISCKDTGDKTIKTEQEVEVIKTEKEVEVIKDSDVKMNIIYAEDDAFIVKVDRLNDNKLKLSLWNKPSTIADEPGTQLDNGTVEKQGSAGGYHFTFIDDEWTIIVKNNLMGESEETTGIILNMLKKGNEKVNSKMKNLKE